MIISLSDEKFKEYADSQGIDASPYFREGNKEVLFYDNYRYYDGTKRKVQKDSHHEWGKNKNTILRKASTMTVWKNDQRQSWKQASTNYTCAAS